jgi:hypothetical protein
MALHVGTGSLILCPLLGAVREADGCGGLIRRDANDPFVWSGRAVQESFSTWLMRSCINVCGLCLERVVLRAIMESARIRSD